jgi:hypothetical protein
MPRTTAGAVRQSHPESLLRHKPEQRAECAFKYRFKLYQRWMVLAQHRSNSTRGST